VGGRPAHDARWAALVFTAGNPDGAHATRRVPPGLPAVRGPARLRHRPARPQLARAGPLTLSRRAATLDVPRPRSTGAGADGGPLHLLVDSTGLKLCGKGEWLLEKHGTATRWSWRMLHLGVDAGTGRIVAATLTSKDVDDASQAGPLLDQVAGAVASFTGDGAYDQDRVYDSVARRHPEAAVVVPPRATAMPSEMAESAPTQRDNHPADRRARAHGMAEHVWIQRAGSGRSHHEPVEAGDRRRVARAYG